MLIVCKIITIAFIRRNWIDCALTYKWKISIMLAVTY